MPTYRATLDYKDASGWTDIEAASMDAAAEKYIRAAYLEVPGLRFWVAIWERDNDYIAEMKGYETYRPKYCKARELIPKMD